MQSEQPKVLSIEIIDKGMSKEMGQEIHDILAGSQDYVDSNIVLNVDEGLFLSFDFFKDGRVHDMDDMFSRLREVVEFLSVHGCRMTLEEIESIVKENNPNAVIPD